MFLTMGLSLRLSVILIVFIFVSADVQELMRKPKHCDILQHLKQTRHKRSAVSSLRPQITVHHYHYYYYCCPEMAARMRDDPRLAQAVNNASCGCDKSSCYCQVPSSQQQLQQQHQQQHYQQQQQQQQQQKQQQHQQQQHQQQQQQSNTQAKTQQTTQQPRRHDPFHIDRMFNDPVGKDFFDFVTNNFVRRDSERELDECLTSAFDDPICKDFFNFFNHNFMRKPYVQTTMPADVSTHAPPHTTQQLKTQQANTQQPKKFKDLKDFQKVDSMFNELENNMKKAFSKTADLGKILGIKLDDFR